MMGTSGLVMLFFWLIVLAAIVLMTVWAVRQFTHAPHQGWGQPGGRHYETWREQPYVGQRGVERGGSVSASQADAAVDAARARYARGEIDREELERILATLRETQ